MTGRSTAHRTPTRGVTLGGNVRDHLGEHVRALYSATLHEELPQALLDPVADLDPVLSKARRSNDEDFRRGLVEAVPRLRAFALSLSGNETRADDLTQEALLRAWQFRHQFDAGTNVKAWLFTILRNQFYGEIRKRKRETEDVDGIAAAKLIALPDQEHTATLRKVEIEMRRMPATMREALILVGAQEMTYEDAAVVLNCAVGTVKSRVSRGRAALAGVID